MLYYAFFQGVKARKKLLKLKILEFLSDYSLYLLTLACQVFVF